MNIRDEFVKHASLAFFASAYADLMEEKGNSMRGEILDQLPNKVDKAAIRAAITLSFDIERINGASLDVLFDFIVNVACGDRPATIEYFGHYAAMQSMGNGVGLCDAFGRYVYDYIKIPYIEFESDSLEKDY